MDKSGILRYFPSVIQRGLAGMPEDVREIRLRTDRPLCVTGGNGVGYLTCDGAYQTSHKGAYTVTAEDIRRTFEAVCRYSVHSCQNQINSGFVTVSGGHRVGICGTAVYTGGSISNIRSVSSLSFRIAREIKGAADGITAALGGRLSSVLIFGEPCSGKTTILRDLCRQTGDRHSVSLIDERGEIAAVSGVSAGCDVGICTDIFSGFSKTDGIRSAVRAMSPVMIFCDEIGTAEDISALELARISGVHAAATVHSNSPEMLMSDERTAPFFTKRLFEYAVHVHKTDILRIYNCNEMISLGKGHGNG